MRLLLIVVDLLTRLNLMALLVGEGANMIEFIATMQSRSLLACCKILFAQCLPEHCVATQHHHQGDRVVSHAYSGKWAEQHFKQIRATDPSALLFAIDLCWDKTSLSKVESAYPIYIKANCWPLDEMNKHRGRMLVGYYDNLPE